VKHLAEAVVEGILKAAAGKIARDIVCQRYEDEIGRADKVLLSSACKVNIFGENFGFQQKPGVLAMSVKALYLKALPFTPSKVGWVIPYDELVAEPYERPFLGIKGYLGWNLLLKYNKDRYVVATQALWSIMELIEARK
jgi:hypothetical protein